MRGEHATIPSEVLPLLRIVPACAGSTRPVWAAPCRRGGSSPHARGALVGQLVEHLGNRDHPRMRGEHEVCRHANEIPDGIIPACAGSTAIASRASTCAVGSSPHARGAPMPAKVAKELARDHPRMRGEHDMANAVAMANGGIIPACAGSTKQQGTPIMPFGGSSPHARGAPERIQVRGLLTGDHPRMRGEHGRRECNLVHHGGIIPACAGSTRAHPS